MRRGGQRIAGGRGRPGRGCESRPWLVRLAILGFAGLLYLAPGALLGSPPLLLNTSPSVPEGLYVRVGGDPRVGDLVAACLPAEAAALAAERGYVASGRRCPGGRAPVLKHLAARPGSRIDYRGSVLLIDAAPWPGSGLRQLDSRGRPLPVARAFPYSVAPGEVLLLTHHPRSFDGRYLGPLPEGAVLGVYRRLGRGRGGWGGRPWP